MKIGKFFFGVFVVGLVVFCGCGKSDQALPTTPPPQAIDAVAFRSAFASAGPDTKATVDQVMMSIQGSLYPDALKALGKLDNDPSLTEAQKKIVKDLIEQVKQKMAAIAAKP